MQHNPNPSIKCSVNNCSHHCSDKDFCSLNEIKVGSCSSSVTSCASTECASFELGKSGSCGCH